MGLISVPILLGRFCFMIVNDGELFMRSDMIKKVIIKHQQRSLLHATGALKHPTDMNKPFVAICNSYIDIVPGHVHLRELADIAKSYSRSGAIPFEFNTIGVDDGIAMGHIECAILFHHAKSLQMLLKLLSMHTGLTVSFTFRIATKSHLV